MRDSELRRFQSHRRLGGHRLSLSRHAVYLRRYYWKRKLRAAGVPEIDLDDTVERVLRLRKAQRANAMHAETHRRSCKAWYDRNREYYRRYHPEYRARRERDERARATLAIGGLG